MIRADVTRDVSRPGAQKPITFDAVLSDEVRAQQLMASEATVTDGSFKSKALPAKMEVHWSGMPLWKNDGAATRDR